jgi:hypothetical protein
VCRISVIAGIVKPLGLANHSHQGCLAGALDLGVVVVLAPILAGLRWYSPRGAAAICSTLRSDEIGTMIRVVQKFKNGLAETERLRSELIGVPSSSSTELEATAQSMTGVAN